MARELNAMGESLDQYERDYPDEVLQKIDPLKLLSKEKWERIPVEPWD